MIYRVLGIDEDIEYGCEERGEDSPVMAIVTLQGEDGLEEKIRVADQFLYDNDINEGNQVVINENGDLQNRQI